jgi:hypothetical protein
MNTKFIKEFLFIGVIIIALTLIFKKICTYFEIKNELLLVPVMILVGLIIIYIRNKTYKNLISKE